MDYFSELLESYSKLKKRTFKLTYICEQEGGGSEGELTQILSQAPVGDEFVPLPGDKYPALARFKYRKSTQTVGKSRDMKPSQSVIVTQGGYQKVALLDDDGVLIKDEKTQDMLEKLLRAMAGEEPPQTGAEAADAAAAAAAEAEEVAALQASYLFLKPDPETGEARYTTDPDDPGNANRAIRSIQGTVNDLITYCNNIGKIAAKSVPWCDKPGKYIVGQDKATLTYKLVNGIGMGPDGEQTPIPADLLADASENHRDFISFITNPPLPGSKEAAERCFELNEKVGFYNGKLLFFGKGRDSEGNINNGVAISHNPKKSTNELYKQALKAASGTCGDVWNPKSIATKAISNAALNTIRGTVNEKCLQIAVKLERGGLTKAQKKELYKDLAKYLYDKRSDLLEFAAGLPPDDDAVGQDLSQFTDSEILMKQARLAREDGGAALVRYTLGVIKQHQEFVRRMDADDAYDFAKAGGSGARSDTVLVYKNDNDNGTAEERANAAAEAMGLDPAKAVTDVGDGTYEIGVGQKDKDGGIAEFKMGEYNTTARRRAAIQGKINPANDSDFGEGFNEWAYRTQFGEDLSTSAEEGGRFQNFIKFEEQLEKDVASAEKLITDGATYIGDNGSFGTLSPESILRSIGKQIKAALKFPGAVDYKITGRATTELEFGQLFYKDKLDFSDASTRAKAAESIGRQIRIQKVMDAINNKDGKYSDEDVQAAKDWVVRNAMMTGGNARDIVQLQTSYTEGRTFATKHNEIFNLINKPGANVEFSAKPGASSIGITVDGMKISLGFERAHGSGGSFQTRTTVNMPKTTVVNKNISQEIKAEAPLDTQMAEEDDGEEAPQEEGTLNSFIRSQMQLFEQFLNSPK